MAARRQFAWTERQEFTALYGRLERRTIDEDADDGYGHFTGKREWRTMVKELPAVSPSLVPVLLPKQIFLNLDDLGAALPDYRQQCIPLDMPSNLESVYTEFDESCLEDLGVLFMRQQTFERSRADFGDAQAETIRLSPPPGSRAQQLSLFV